jgi:hypothetical protein
MERTSEPEKRPTERVCIPIEKILECEAFRREVQRHDLNDIEFTKDGKPVDIPQKYKDDWKFTGMGNWHFIADGFYLEGWTRLLIPDEEKVVKGLGFVQDKEWENIWRTRPPIPADGVHCIERTQELFCWSWSDGYGHFKTNSFSSFEELVKCLDECMDVEEMDKKWQEYKEAGGGQPKPERDEMEPLV